MRGATASPVSVTDCRSFFMILVLLRGLLCRARSGNANLRRLAPGLFLVGGAPGSVLESFEASRIQQVIFLMKVLRRPEFRRRKNFSHDRLIEFAGVREFFF